jgi:hypothetical protein
MAADADADADVHVKIEHGHLVMPEVILRASIEERVVRVVVVVAACMSCGNEGSKARRNEERK